MVNLIVKEVVNVDDGSLSEMTPTLVEPKFRWKITVSSSSSSSDRVIKGDWMAGIQHGKEKLNDCSWPTSNICDLGDDIDAIVTFRLQRKKVVKQIIGETSFTLGELIKMCQDKKEGIADLMLFQNDTENVVVAGGRAYPSIVSVAIEPNVESEGNGGGKCDIKPYNKRVMIVTRGTRGDVQPFIALARGLANMENCEVIFVTELEFKAEILKNHMSSNENGRIRFRPSGGNTTKKVNEALSQFAINFKIAAPQTNAMQSLFLSRSEVTFFSSEPAVYYWAQQLKPDFLIYGFTMATVSMIVSEALGIPLVGFILQPTCIPSSQYPPYLPLKEKNYRKLNDSINTSKRKNLVFLKNLMDNMVVSGDNLASLRKRRGLKSFGFSTNSYQELLSKNFPLIVPINETLFGGKPNDWSENAVFTDCIFLRGDHVPPIAPDAQAFLDCAKAMSGKVVVLAFSSMPVTKSQIVSIALKLINECDEKNKVCIFALVRGTELDLPLSNKKLEKECQEARDDGRLFLAARVPFGRLFSLVDAIVLHGGLGTTCEALQAKVPCIVTGVLLLDQRFWGMRCSEMSVGPFGSHIDDFPKYCVKYVDKALQDDSEWRQNADRIGSVMSKEAMEDPSGVQRNVDCVIKMAKVAKPYWFCPDNAFGAFDRDGDGELSLDEITEMFESLDLSFDEAKIKELFRNADKNRNGTIDRNEFKDYMYQKFMEIIEES